MDGRLVPAGLLDETPLVANLFENIATVQFDHRVLAIGLAAYALALWAAGRRAAPCRRTRAAFDALLAAVAVQLGLGIATLLTVVALPLAAAHQAGALVVFTAALWLLHELRTPARARPAA